MDRTRLTGVALMGLSVVQVLLFLLAAARRRYAAVALPGAAGVMGISVLAFWVGWTLVSLEDDLTGLEFEAEPREEP